MGRMVGDDIVFLIDVLGAAGRAADILVEAALEYTDNSWEPSKSLILRLIHSYDVNEIRHAVLDACVEHCENKTDGVGLYNFLRVRAKHHWDWSCKYDTEQERKATEKKQTSKADRFTNRAETIRRSEGRRRRRKSSSRSMFDCMGRTLY